MADLAGPDALDDLADHEGRDERHEGGGHEPAETLRPRGEVVPKVVDTVVLDTSEYQDELCTHIPTMSDPAR